MESNHKRDVYDFLYDKFGSRIRAYNPSPVENKYFEIINDNMKKKSEKRLESIKKRIVNDINKNNYVKKYQISSRFEYERIKEFVNTLNIDKYEFLWHADQNGVERNKLYRIIEGDYTCCRDCDRPMTFKNIKTFVRYCYFYKKID